MAFVSDERPSAFGNMIVVTGTVASGDTTADLSDFMSEILMAQVQPSHASGTASVAKVAGTTVSFSDISHASGGRLFALGKR